MLSKQQSAQIDVLFSGMSEVLARNSALPSPSDYASLKEQILFQELQHELATLQELFNANEEGLAESFKGQCRKRVTRNKNTCLSFIANPKGDCNSLYWQLAEIIFSPKTLGEMLSILSPDIKSVLTHDVMLPPNLASRTSQNLILRLEEEGLDSLAQWPEFDAMQNLVIADVIVFDITNITHFNFDMHCKLYRELQRHYPELAKKLYQHNDDFKKLYSDILLFVEAKSTPLEVLQTLVNDLFRGGSTLTGDVYASQAAQASYLRTKEYLASLPETYRQQLLELKGIDCVLGTIFEDLRQDNCVETAARQLQTILNYKQNKFFLQTKPDLAATHVAELKQLYKKKLLDNKGQADSIQLPEQYLALNLHTIVIRHENHFINILLSFPPHLYTDLFKYIQFVNIHQLVPLIGKMIKNSLFNDEQVTAINYAIKANLDKLGGLEQGLKLIVNGNYQLLTLLLAEIPPESYLTILRNVEVNNQPFLSYAVNDAMLMDFLLTLLRAEDRLEAMLEKNTSNNNALESVIHDPERLHLRLQLVPEEMRLTLIMEKNEHGDNLLEQTIYRPEIFKILLESLPEQSRLTLIMEKNKDRDNLLEQTIYYPETFKILLESLPEQLRLALITEKNEYGNNFLEEKAIYSPEICNILLESLPEQLRLALFKEKNEHKNNLLDQTIYKPETFKILFEFLPEQLWLALILKKDKHGNNLLEQTISKPKTFKVLFEFLPEQLRLTLITEKNRCGNNLLEHTINTPETFKILLESLPEQLRLALITEKNRCGNNLLNQTIYTPKTFKILLESLPEQLRLVLILEKYNDGNNLLEQVINTPKVLKILFDFLSPQEQKFCCLQRNARGRTLIEQTNEPDSYNFLIDQMPEHGRLAMLLYFLENNWIFREELLPILLLQIMAKMPLEEQLIAFVKMLAHEVNFKEHLTTLLNLDAQLLKRLFAAYEAYPQREKLTDEQKTLLGNDTARLEVFLKLSAYHLQKVRPDDAKRYGDDYIKSLNSFHRQATLLCLNPTLEHKVMVNKVTELAHQQFKHRHSTRRLIADIFMLLGLPVTVFIGAGRVLTGKTFFFSHEKTKREKEVIQQLVTTPQQRS